MGNSAWARKPYRKRDAGIFQKKFGGFAKVVKLPFDINDPSNKDYKTKSHNESVTSGKPGFSQEALLDVLNALEAARNSI
jgi:hypothetical protein